MAVDEKIELKFNNASVERDRALFNSAWTRFVMYGRVFEEREN